MKVLILMRTSSKFLFLIYFFILVANSKFTQAQQDPVRGNNGMVVTEEQIGTQVGIEILKKGGNAIDAAVAIGFTLAVTYPSAGNLGGGGFMVIHLANEKNITIDFREKAPISSAENMYVDKNGNVNSDLSLFGGSSAGIPGSVAGLIYALDNYGTMKLAEIIQPAIDIAENGFELDYHLAESLQEEFKYFERYPSSMKVFTNNGEIYKDGDIFRQPDLCKTLTLIRDFNRDGFYKGEISNLIIQQINSTGGNVSQKDFDEYNVVEREPIISNYRGYDVVSMGPPSAGGLVLTLLLNILENESFKFEQWGSSKYIRLVAEAMKYAYLQRSSAIGDEDFFPVNKARLTSKIFAKEIFDKIILRVTPSAELQNLMIEQKPESFETTHYSVCDQFGNAVSTTTTINSSFGSKMIVEGAGFLLNNEMDDFSSKPGSPNQFGLIGSAANSIEPGKRMLSSMTPTIVLKNSKPFLILGAPGGSTITTAVLQVILNCIDFDMDIQRAIDMPRFHHQFLPDEINFEYLGVTEDVKQNLRSFGFIIGKNITIGRVEGIMIKDNIMYGAADPRGHGIAIGF